MRSSIASRHRWCARERAPAPDRDISREEAVVVAARLALDESRLNRPSRHVRDGEITEPIVLIALRTAHRASTGVFSDS